MSFSLNHIFLYSTLFNSLFHTWDEVTTLVPTSSISASSVSASPIPASSVPTVCHAGDAAHRFSRRPAISSPPAALLRLSAEASLGDLVRFPSFAAIKSVKSIPVAVAPVPVAPTFAARTRPNGKGDTQRGHFNTLNQFVIMLNGTTKLFVFFETAVGSCIQRGGQMEED